MGTPYLSRTEALSIDIDIHSYMTNRHTQTPLFFSCSSFVPTRILFVVRINKFVHHNCMFRHIIFARTVQL